MYLTMSSQHLTKYRMTSVDFAKRPFVRSHLPSIQSTTFHNSQQDIK